MAMKVKAVEKLLKFDKNSAGVYRYVMSPEMYSSLNQKKWHCPDWVPCASVCARSLWRT